jgi:hypothetical protein
MTYTVDTHEGRYFVTDGDHTFGDFATYTEALERALELEADLDRPDGARETAP